MSQTNLAHHLGFLGSSAICIHQETIGDGKIRWMQWQCCYSKRRHDKPYTHLALNGESILPPPPWKGGGWDSVVFRWMCHETILTTQLPSFDMSLNDLLEAGSCRKQLLQPTSFSHRICLTQRIYRRNQPPTNLRKTSRICSVQCHAW